MLLRVWGRKRSQAGVWAVSVVSNQRDAQQAAAMSAAPGSRHMHAPDPSFALPLLPTPPILQTTGCRPWL